MRQYVTNGRQVSASDDAVIKITAKVEELKQQLKDRVYDARIIAENNKDLFVPYNVNSFIIQPSFQDQTSLMKSKTL